MQVHHRARLNQVFDQRPMVLLHGDHDRRSATVIQTVHACPATNQHLGHLFVAALGCDVQRRATLASPALSGTLSDERLHLPKIAHPGGPTHGLGV